MDILNLFNNGDNTIIDNINGIPITSDILNKFKYEIIKSVYSGGYYSEDNNEYNFENLIYNIDIKSQLYQFIQKLNEIDSIGNIKYNENSLLLIGLAGNGKTQTIKLIKCLIGANKLFRISPYFLLLEKMNKHWKEYINCLFVSANHCYNKSIIEIEDYEYFNVHSNQEEYNYNLEIKNYILQQHLKYKNNILLIVTSNKPEKLIINDTNSFSKFLYIPLPDEESRLLLISNWISNEKHTLSKSNLKQLSINTENFTYADLISFLKGSVGQLFNRLGGIDDIDSNTLPPFILNDFINSLNNIRSGYSIKQIKEFKNNCLKLNLKIN